MSPSLVNVRELSGEKPITDYCGPAKMRRNSKLTNEWQIQGAKQATVRVSNAPGISH